MNFLDEMSTIRITMRIQKQNTSFAQFLFYSILLHGCIFLLIAMDMKFIKIFPKKNIQIKKALRVDTIGLPDLQKQNSPKPVKKKIPSVQIQKKKKKAIKKAVKTRKKLKKIKPKLLIEESYTQKQSQALDKLKALEQIKQMEEEEMEYRGQQVSKGDSAQGEKMEDFAIVQYFTSIRGHINMYWSLPMELAEQNLRAQIHTEISDTGVVLKRTIMQSSGNEEFDARVLETIDRASPFPPPPNEVKSSLSDGIVFQFPE